LIKPISECGALCPIARDLDRALAFPVQFLVKRVDLISA